MSYILLIAGFVLLIKGADFFVDGCASIARSLKIPAVIIGLTIVAIGTSAPEAAVSITASIAGNNDIALSNVIGSNLFNLLIVIGICALLADVDTNHDILKRDLPVNAAVSLVLIVFLFDRVLSRIEGLLLAAVLLIYMAVIVKKVLKDRQLEEESVQERSLLLSIIASVGGIAAVILGGDMVVDNASAIAVALGMSQTLVGLTIVAVGTSLPELVTSITAVRHGETGMALGNAVGSCIFNILLILGVSSALSPITAVNELFIDACLLTAVSVIIFIFARTQNKTIRIEGAICVALYLGYMVYAVLR